MDDVGFYVGRVDDEVAAVPALRRAELDELRPQPLVVKSRVLGDGVAVRARFVRRDVARLAPPEPDESMWKSNFRRLIELVGFHTGVNSPTSLFKKKSSTARGSRVRRSTQTTTSHRCENWDKNETRA